MKINLFYLKITAGVGAGVVSSAILHCYVVILSFAQREKEKRNQCQTVLKKADVYYMYHITA